MYCTNSDLRIIYYKKKKPGKYQLSGEIPKLYKNKSNRNLSTNKAIWGGGHTPKKKEKTIQDLYGLHIIIYYYLAVNTIPWFHS